MKLFPKLCRGARGLLGWSQKELATRARVARKTIADLELGYVTPQPRTLRDLIAVLEAAGVEFLPEEKNITLGGIRLAWEPGTNPS